jgi:hypothetical protein
MFGVRKSENCRSQQWVVKSDAADSPQNVAAPRLNLVGSTRWPGLGSTGASGSIAFELAAAGSRGAFASLARS